MSGERFRAEKSVRSEAGRSGSFFSSRRMAAFVKGAAGGAEFEEVVGEEGCDQRRVVSDEWVEEALL
jgi:hypothetical protein